MSRQKDAELYDVCVVGLGYVGQTLAVAFAMAGSSVIGLDTDSHVLREIEASRTTFYERGFEEDLRRVREQNRFGVQHASEPLPKASNYVITVGTPLKNGRVDLDALEASFVSVVSQMPEDSLVVVRSTVSVGASRAAMSKAVSRIGKRFKLAVAPERTVEGIALEELSDLPQIIGAVDEASAAAATGLFATLGVEVVRVSSLEAAEFAKLASNTARDLTFAISNELAYLADELNVDVYEAIDACNAGYPRANIALPGPVGGPCLTKDAIILATSTRAMERPSFALAGRATNTYLTQHVLSRIADQISAPPKVIGIIGLAFKGAPETSDTRGSLATDLACQAKAYWPETEVIGWDPVASMSEEMRTHVRATALDTLVTQSKIVILQTRSDYSASPEMLRALERLPRDATIVDLWNQVPLEFRNRPDLKVLTLGRTSSAMNQEQKRALVA